MRTKSQTFALSYGFPLTMKDDVKSVAQNIETENALRT